MRFPETFRRSGVAWCYRATAADASGFTPLMIAAEHSGRIDVMRELIGAGADVNVLTTNGWAALRDAVKSGEPAKVHLLLDRGAKLLIAPRNTNRMLIISIIQEDTATLAALLDRGLDPNHLTNGAFTGLMSAASHGLEGPLELLLRRGARPDGVEQRDGFTALMYAAVTDPGHERIVRALVRAGARLDVKSTAGLTARDYAVKYGHTHLLAALTRP